MPSNRQKHLAHFSKISKFLHVKGRGLIHRHSLHDRFLKNDFTWNRLCSP